MTQLLSAFRMPFQQNEVLWKIIEAIGMAAFFSRFFVQWLYSEKHKDSKVPTIFWWQSIFGAILMLAYTLRQRDWILALGYVGTVIPYSRNLVLVYRKKRREREANAQELHAIAHS